MQIFDINMYHSIISNLHSFNLKYDEFPKLSDLSSKVVLGSTIEYPADMVKKAVEEVFGLAMTQRSCGYWNASLPSYFHKDYDTARKRVSAIIADMKGDSLL